MTYLYKHTPLQTTVPVNLTCLVPTANPEVAEPARLSLTAILRHFLDFRFETVAPPLQSTSSRSCAGGSTSSRGSRRSSTTSTRRSGSSARADGKADAAAKLMKRFGLDEEQADAVLETKLYKLARLEIESIRKELGREAGRGGADRGDPEVAREALGGRPARARRAARRPLGREAEDARLRRGRGAGVRRRGVHPRRGRLRGRHRRRVAEAPRAAEGPEADAPARGGRRPRRPAGRRRASSSSSSATGARPTSSA